MAAYQYKGVHGLLVTLSKADFLFCSFFLLWLWLMLVFSDTELLGKLKYCVVRSPHCKYGFCNHKAPISKAVSSPYIGEVPHWGLLTGYLVLWKPEPWLSTENRAVATAVVKNGAHQCKTVKYRKPGLLRECSRLLVTERSQFRPEGLFSG